MPDRSVVALNASPGALAGSCTNCGTPIHNPSRQERIGLSMTLRWIIFCPGCGGKITIENPRFLTESR